MTRIPHDYRSLGRRLLLLEAEAGASPEGLARAAELVLVRLHGSLGPLIGSSGAHALLAHALHLARAEHPCLGVVVTAPDRPGRLDGLAVALSGLTADETAAALGAVVGALVWVLAALIGEDLALAHVRETWADLDGMPVPGMRRLGGR